MKSNALITWILVAIVVWAGISTYWYVCGIKNFCISTPVVVHDKKPSGEEVVNRDDEFVNTSGRRDRQVVTGTITEEITIQCPSYLETFIRYGYTNDATDVRRLEVFLNTHENENLSEDGVFGRDDEDAVKRFQLKYREAVMNPWGMTSPSGFVYTTTRNHINVLQCTFDYVNGNQ